MFKPKNFLHIVIVLPLFELFEKKPGLNEAPNTMSTSVEVRY